MKVWKYLNTPISKLRGRNTSEIDPDEALRASIRAKTATYSPDMHLTASPGISVAEGEPCAIEMHPVAFVAAAVCEAWRTKDTFPQFATNAQMNDFQFSGHPPAILNAKILDELEFLKRLCKNHLSSAIDKNKNDPWKGMPDDKHYFNDRQ